MADNTDNNNNFSSQETISRSSEESCEQQNDPSEIEERFRIDRKKLEQMLKNELSNSEYGTEAEEFFEKVMKATSTTITWPSRLKIGAKSKKDPHIKVFGTAENIQLAKEHVMRVLDSKSQRVTLKIEVPYTEHSHVIGKGGQNIRKVMEKTNCHIHFPDSNRGNTQDKSNQVSISGSPKGVEEARDKIRALQPLLVSFEIAASLVPAQYLDSSSEAIEQLQYGNNVTIMTKYRGNTIVIAVRSSAWNVNAIKVIISELSNGRLMQIPVKLQMEMSHQHHAALIGRHCSALNQAMTLSQTKIQLSEISTCKRYTATIVGFFDSVFVARQIILGYLPIVLMFDAKEDAPFDQASVNTLASELELNVHIKPKPKQSSKSVNVKTKEQNIIKAFQSRQRLLCLSSEDNVPTRPESSIPPPVTNSYYHQPVVLLAPSSQMPPSYLYTPTRVVQSMKPPESGNKKHFYSRDSLRLKTITERKANGAPTKSHTSTLNSAQWHQTKDAKPLDRNLATESKSNQNNDSFSGKDINLKLTSSTNSLPDVRPPPGLTKACGSYSFGCTEMKTKFGEAGLAKRSQGSAKLLDELFKSKRTPFAVSDVSGTSPASCESGVELDSDDTFLNEQRKAPGANRPTRISNHFDSSLIENNVLFAPNRKNYEERKHLADLAIQKRPEGETRSPTNFFSGYGFSKSMSCTPLENSVRNIMLQSSELCTMPENDPKNDIDSIAAVSDILHQNDLDKYITKFAEEEIDMSTFLTLNESDLKELHIDTFGARRKIILLIKSNFILFAINTL
ncbi:DgyrCDS7358 [Dimorphilus gyrociliatus]|uniref:DgyrCDS7358 n=1 Tax=Dimorphilus gyrociliatus TaxID=2664684 RepID=A0A7I8VT17_9ANNE|nr:DgyrCDS7358 [Dimorphilus gyrociliatus]